MTTELQIAQGFQTLFRAMSEFSVGDVVINDDSIYDGAIVNCPYLIIYTMEDFEVTPASARNVRTATLPVTHIEQFTTYEETYNNLRDRREAMINEVFTGVGMSANSQSGVSVLRIFNLSDIHGWTYEETDGQTFPVYIQQVYGIEMRIDPNG